MDVRTAPVLRSNIAAILVRLQAPSDCGIHELARILVEQEYTSWILGASLKPNSKKRKRGRNRVCKPIVRDPQSLIDISLAIKGHGLSQNCTGFPVGLQKAFLDLHADCTGGSTLASADKTCLLLAYMERCMCEGQKRCREMFSQLAGMDIFDLLTELLSNISKMQFVVSDVATDFERKLILCRAAMRISDTANRLFGQDGSTRLPVESMCRITNSVAKHILPTSKHPLVMKSSPGLELDALSVLGSIGDAIQLDCPNQILQDIRETFETLLSRTGWPVYTVGITSLQRFGTAVKSQIGRSLLPRCLPSSRFKLFESRVNEKLWRDKQLGSVEKDSVVVAYHISRELEQCCCLRKELGKSIFPTTAEMTVAPGSYVVEMKTQDGRTAMVIFRPVPESLDDIEYMLAGAEDLPTVHTVRRIVATPSGNAKCFLTA